MPKSTSRKRFRRRRENGRARTRFAVITQQAVSMIVTMNEKTL